MPSGQYEIVKYQPKFKDQILALQNGLWGPEPHLNAAYLQWKYDQNPYIDEPLIWLALAAGQVVGMLGSFGVAWEMGPAELLRSLSLADLVVDPAHRNRRIFPQLLEFAMRELAQLAYPVVFDLTASPEVTLVMQMNGWRSLYLQTAHRRPPPPVAGDLPASSWSRQQVGKLRNYAKTQPLIAGGYQQLRQVKQRVFTQPATHQARPPFQTLDTNHTSRWQDKPHISVQTTPRPMDMARLIRQLPTDERIRHIRDEQYFGWRFQNPLSCYRFLFWEAEQLEGYLVLQTKMHTDDDAAWVNIVDWEATSEPIALDLLNAALAWGEFKELEIWSATLPAHRKNRLAEANFCFRNRTGSAVRDVAGEHLLMHPLPTKSEKAPADRLDVLTSWDIRMIYADGV